MNSYSQKQFSYLIVTIAYWTFMLSDGTLRMLVLLHFHQNGFSPLQLAYLFLFYELAGIFTNLSAGWLATKFGLRLTLHLGLSIQVVSIFFLSIMPSPPLQNACLAIPLGVPTKRLSSMVEPGWRRTWPMILGRGVGVTKIRWKIVKNTVAYIIGMRLRKHVLH